MSFQKVEYSFPDEENDTSIAVEDSGAVEIDLSGTKSADEYADTNVESEAPVEEKAEALDIEVVDDTPEDDRDRRPSNHRLMSRTKSWKATQKQSQLELNIWAKSTTTSVEPKSQPSENGKN